MLLDHRELLKRFHSISALQLLEDRIFKSLITCGAVGREIIACFVTAPSLIKGVLHVT